MELELELGLELELELELGGGVEGPLVRVGRGGGGIDVCGLRGDAAMRAIEV